ncbi:7025_t:CDS:2 [Funneliformis geosporum]|nr:7025_t:CDS:2 [Funneliformis geosporum]
MSNHRIPNNVKSIEDKKIGDFIPEESDNVSDSVIAQLKQCKHLQIEEVIEESILKKSSANEGYEKKVVTLSTENNISKQMVRIQIYDEMELFLPGKKREYLHKMTQKAKNIYTLFKGIGIDKVEVVISSADAISRLTDI